MKLKVFAIGNSFSANAIRFLPQIAESSADCSLTIAQAYIGGCPIEKHLHLARLHEAEPENPEGSPYEVDGRRLSLREMLMKESWDIVTIQQFSGYSYKPETYRPYARELCEYVRRYCLDAELAIHQTWAYRRDNASAFTKDFTPEDMYRGLRDAYNSIAAELDIRRVIPVGNAFQLVDETPGQTFVPDSSFEPEKAVKPQLPKQEPSLHVGWFWGADGVLRYDHGHANVRGEFLGGCVWFEKLFGKDVRKSGFKPPALAKGDAEFLREMAHKVVSEGVLPEAAGRR
jgi:hypothetical protein